MKLAAVVEKMVAVLDGGCWWGWRPKSLRQDVAVLDRHGGGEA